MIDDPTTPPSQTPESPAEGAPVGEPPPFQPDPELIGYLEREQKGAPDRR